MLKILLNFPQCLYVGTYGAPQFVCRAEFALVTDPADKPHGNILPVKVTPEVGDVGLERNVVSV